MVKHLKLSLRKLKLSKSESNPKSPLVQIQSAPILSKNGNIFYSEEELYSKDDNYLDSNTSFDTDSCHSESISSNSSLNICSDKELKNLRKQKKIKKSLSEVGNKHIVELIAYLHSDRLTNRLAKSKLDIDRDELELLHSVDGAVDLDKYFEEKTSKVKDKLWRMPIVFSKRDPRNLTDFSPNGVHSVNRFGDGVADGCSVSLSLSSKGRTFGDVFHKSLEWNDIIEEADQVLNNYENLGKRKTRMARRGSLLQPRMIFLSPHPEGTYERVLQSANCLPLRTWTSELFLDSKESSQLMDCETKRNLKWNASVEDFRHLLSPELSHFGNDVYSMLVQARRRMSLCPPQAVTKPIPFRRKSYRNGEVWAPMESNKHKKKDYDRKLGVITSNSSTSLEIKSHPLNQKSKSTSNLLTVPHESVGAVNFKKNPIDYRRNDSNESLDFIEIESIDPKVVANELTLIAKEIFLSIKSTEIIILLIRPNSISPDTCSDITALLGFQKRIIQLIVSYILDKSDVQISARRMAFFIEVAKELKSLRNWHSVYSVVQSLQSPPIARLRQSWQFISNEFSDSYCEFIDLSEQIKKDVGPLDYTTPSIPLFNDLMDDLKERCGSKFFEIKNHRFHCHWSERETAFNSAVWVDQQIVDLLNAAKDMKKTQKKVEKIHNSNESQNKGIFQRMLSKTSTKDSWDSCSVSSNGSDARNGSLASVGSESKRKSKLLAQNSPNPSCKNIWSATDVQKLRQTDEKEILEEIARGLVYFQRKVTFYYLNDSNESVRKFLLMQSYEEMDVCMKRSYALEAPKSSANKKPIVQINY